jgi:hypothetical protein
VSDSRKSPSDDCQISKSQDSRRPHCHDGRSSNMRKEFVDCLENPSLSHSIFGRPFRSIIVHPAIDVVRGISVLSD